MRIYALILIFALPVHGWISSPFGVRHDPFTSRQAFHSGVDIAQKYASAVKCVKPGDVTFAGKKTGYGNLVIINHENGLQIYYGHLGRIFVSPGQKVVEGQNLGWMGMTGRATGSHVHFEVRQNGFPIKPNFSS